MTHSADQLSDVRLCNDKVRVGDNHPIEVVTHYRIPRCSACSTVGCGLHAGLAFNLFSLMAAQNHRGRFLTKEEDLWISRFDGS